MNSMDVAWYKEVFQDAVTSVVKIIYYVLLSCFKFFYTPRKNLKNEIVLLTGASGGMGALIAKKMVDRGCIVILWDINKDEMEKLAHSINKYTQQRQAYLFKCDITDKNEVDAVTAEVIRTVGHPTMLINNAGIVAGKYFLDLTEEEIQCTFNVNIMSHYSLVKQFLPNMLENNHGHIVCISSILGLDSIAGVSDYGPSKAATVGFMHALRQEIRLLGKDNIFCTTVLPYQVKTDMFRGCSVRFPSFPLLNIQCPNYVTDKIVEAIEKNQITLYVPRILYIAIVIMHILPEYAYDVLYDFMRTNQAMRKHIGCGSKNE